MDQQTRARLDELAARISRVLNNHYEREIAPRLTEAGGESFDALAHTVTVEGDWPRCVECEEYGSHEQCQPEALAEQAEWDVPSGGAS